VVQLHHPAHKGRYKMKVDNSFKEIKSIIARTCKYPKCYYYTKGASSYCCGGCAFDHYDYDRLKKEKRKRQRRKSKKGRKNKMRRFYYTLTFSSYINSVLAKNKKDAGRRLKKLWPEYNIKKIVSLC
jgi:hypothetical protein